MLYHYVLPLWNKEFIIILYILYATDFSRCLHLKEYALVLGVVQSCHDGGCGEGQRVERPVVKGQRETHHRKQLVGVTSLTKPLIVLV